MGVKNSGVNLYDEHKQMIMKLKERFNSNVSSSYIIRRCIEVAYKHPEEL